ncbi:hypothetical protein FACS189485_17770 [Spirochaetia bacterium]|nr:hypothetical protein FACS189485_17770 [Spirochaetia bacterium]
MFRISSLITFVLLTANTYLFGIDIIITPINYFEKSGNNYIKTAYEKDIAVDIEEWLNRYYSTRLDKNPPNDKLIGVSEIDARRLSEFYQVNYVLFGTIRDEGGCLNAEIKLYNERQNEYISFLASDANTYYNRLIKTICEHILDWFHVEKDKVGRLNNEIDELREEIGVLKSELNSKKAPEKHILQKEEPVHEVTLRMPVRAGYWTYTGTDWIEFVQGTTEGSFGLDFSPELQFTAFGGRRNEITFSLLFGYSYGTTSKRDIVNVHNILINPSINYFLNVYTNNWLAGSVGVIFEHGIWHVEETDYGVIRDYQQFLTGISTSFEYLYRFNKTMAMELGANMYFYFAENTSQVIKMYLGAVFTLLGGNYEK